MRFVNNYISLLFAYAIIVAACSPENYVVQPEDNQEFRANTEFTSFEDISLSKFDSIKKKYQLDTIFHGEQDEFKRILLLRNWIRNKISINDFGDPYPGGDHPQGIIDAAMGGQGFHCGHYMVVQNAIMNAFGFVTRCLGSGPGIKGGTDGHHGMNEIWLNSKGKWFLSDAKFNHHFEKNGVPLSALEVRDEFLLNKANEIVLVKGPERTPIQYDSLKNNKGVYLKRNKEWFAQWYTWIEWDRAANRFSAWPQFNTPLNMYEDDYFRKNTWIWDGKPHWAYNTEHMIKVNRREAIEWTPNTIKGDVTIHGNNAIIKLTSTTPNFREYQMKDAADQKWSRCDSVMNLRLNQNKHQLSFRAVNIANVAGPEYRITIAAQ